MPNRLAGANSPYLLQHADNPVEWYPWGEEALAQARDEDKPIFLSIGYAACHWCHVMAHESFENDGVAGIMNENFVCIKVDREERPDLDAIYMQATTSMTGSGGWPMSVFLTPDLRPFYAGTYFPPVPRYNMPAFSDLLLALAKSWREDREQIFDVAGRVRAAIGPPASEQGPAPTEEIMAVAEAALVMRADRKRGGWGGAPKFPQPMAIEFLLRRAAADVTAHGDGLAVASETLRLMARGGMYDALGGGFARYSTDVNWLVPHFEKMLYDNAQLALVYTQAHKLTGSAFYKDVAVQTLQFVSRELMHPQGGFYSSLDADSEGSEGRYYAWTEAELRQRLVDAGQYEVFAAAYGITAQGNWEGQIVLQRALDDATLAARLHRPVEEVTKILARCHAVLFEARQARVRPATDDKIICAWNGLMLRAIAQAARYLDESENGSDLRRVATRNAEFLLAQLRRPDGLRRIWRDGKSGDEVFLEDYAALILGLIELYQVDFNARWYIAARELLDEMIEQFSDPAGGFFDTPSTATPVLIRPKDLQDSATPCGNSLACEALLRMAALTGEGSYRDMAETTLRIGMQNAVQYPTSFARWLCAADLALSGDQQLAIVYPPGSHGHEFLRVAQSTFRPNLTIGVSAFPTTADSPPLLMDRPLLDGRATAYLCEGMVCKQPTNDPSELEAQL